MIVIVLSLCLSLFITIIAIFYFYYCYYLFLLSLFFISIIVITIFHCYPLLFLLWSIIITSIVTFHYYNFHCYHAFICIFFNMQRGSVPKAPVAKVSELTMATFAVPSESAPLELLWQHSSLHRIPSLAKKKGPAGYHNLLVLSREWVGMDGNGGMGLLLIVIMDHSLLPCWAPVG